MNKLCDIYAVWSFVGYQMPETKTPGFTQGFKLRFGQVCEANNMTVPTRLQDWDWLDKNAGISEQAEKRLGELSNWLKRQSPEFKRRFDL